MSNKRPPTMVIVENPSLGGMSRRDHPGFMTDTERSINHVLETMVYFDSHPLVDEARKMLREARELVSTYIDLRLQEAAKVE